jgi:hypothetical protein
MFHIQQIPQLLPRRNHQLSLAGPIARALVNGIAPNVVAPIIPLVVAPKLPKA